MNLPKNTGQYLSKELSEHLIKQRSQRMNLLKWGKFKSHSGLDLDWKIDCDALSDEDIECLASIIAGKCRYHEVIPVETGGNRLAKALEPFKNPGSPTTLIVDDVYTTGLSMEAMKAQVLKSIVLRDHRVHRDDEIEGVVIFARKYPAWWVWPLFSTYSSIFDQGNWRPTNENVTVVTGNDGDSFSRGTPIQKYET